MARYLSSSTLIESAKVRGAIPETQVTFKEEDLLRFANEEMDTAVIPYVMSFHEDYFLFREDIPLQADTTQYAIPYRAVGNKLREVAYKDLSDEDLEFLFTQSPDFVIEKRPDWVKKHYPNKLN